MLHKRLFEPIRRGGSASAADVLGESVTSTGSAVFPLVFDCDGSGHVIITIQIGVTEYTNFVAQIPLPVQVQSLWKYSGWQQCLVKCWHALQNSSGHFKLS